METEKNDNHSQTFLNFLFGLFTIFIHLELNIPALIEKHLDEYNNGIVSPKLLATVIAAIIITASSFVFILIYKKIWWPFWGVYNSRRGWWLYALIDERYATLNDVIIVGKFYLDHRIDTIAVRAAMAYYATDDGKQIDYFRTHWEAEDIVIKKGLIKIDYLIKNAQQSNHGFAPAKYEGRMTLKEKTDHDTIIGKNKYDGHIIDLSAKDNFSGWIYCERLGFWQTRKKDISKEYLDKYVARLVKRVKSMTPAIKKELLEQPVLTNNGQEQTTFNDELHKAT